MGKKLQETADIIGEQGSPNTHKTDKKKKKKNKHRETECDERTELSVKRKLEETDVQESSKKEKRKKKNKEGKEKEKENETNQESHELDQVNCKEGDEERVMVTGKDAKEAKYAALKSFSESNLPDNVLKCCQSFKNPSPIQAHAWPFLLDGRDFIGIAKTGSGKTLAYGIPAVMHVLSKRKGASANSVNPLCLVLAPTRELADQISVVLRDAGEPCGVRSVCLYGGTSKGPQISSLKSGVDIVIATPGRLKDLIEMNICHLMEVSFLVLDEADRMLDMGFRQEVRSILSKTCSARQMIMFSATWPLDVHNLAEEYMDRNPIKVVVGSEDTAANHDVMQIVEVLDDHLRDKRLLALLEKYHKTQRVLVFALYQKEAERLDGMLHRSGWNVVSIHGNKAQEQRTKALSLFKKGSCPLMVATDVAARGLDVPDVEVVINYSFPLTTEDYVHRIGRTGRAGKKGVAHTFFTHHNKGLAGELVNVLREAGQVVPDALLKFGTHVKKKESKLYGAHFREISADAPKAKKITFNSDDED
ncbi:DEAD-box ATP-dependent RNA helicase 5 isoform X2 [Ricinus communis]|uniref:DEAD-box ATP-dependent RNA helicase 5 isoform X2 n=1 Tax=Ricinus communis TaxID=3988 RepID=UPI000772D2F5|nr:DEAD-box ATP-dependent RNA helicase 5 isoform X2 [Ricinus communis]|eukprot:XP_015574503.1 DEAD-box ATP-dependent RNA helicase 5 isoform X2 [Ricinus communis]